MASDPQLAVVAVGGNSLIVDDQHVAIPYQAEAAAVTSHHIAEMIAEGWNVVITHGNGPQVGFILRRCEIGIHEVPPIPMDYATSNTQGSIGYMFQKALANELRRRRIDRRVVTLITQTLVDRDDPAMTDPSKPIGPHLDEATARRRAAEHGWAVKEDAGRGFRRVVPSPLPRAIVELEVIRGLAASGTVVIACGGGGLPVYRDAAGDLHGLEAVIDKDYASGLLARELGADLFLILTAVEKVAVAYRKPGERWLDRLTVSEARAYDRQGHFAAGSMKPKIRAMIEFLEATGARGLVTDPPNVMRALAGETGTLMLPD